MNFFEWFDAKKAKAESTDYGQAFLKLGFEFWHSGGGLTAWRKAHGATEFLASNDDSGVPDDPDSGWIVGQYVTESGEVIFEDDCGTWLDVVQIVSDRTGQV